MSDVELSARKSHRVWVLPLALAVVTGLIGTAILLSQAPIYQVQAQVITISSPGDVDPRATLFTANTASPTTIIEGLFNSRPAVRFLAQQLGQKEEEVGKRYAVSADTASGIIGISLDVTDPESGKHHLSNLFSKIRNLEVDTAQSSAALNARQLSESVAKRTKEYEKAQEDFAQLLRASKTPFNGEMRTATEFSRSLEDLRGELEGTKALHAQAKKALSDELNNPEWPKNGVEREVASHLEMLRQKVTESKQYYQELSAQYNKDAPQLVNARAELEAAESVYKRELATAKQGVRMGLERSLMRLEGQRKMLEYQIAAKREIVRKAPQETSAVGNAVRNLTLLRTALSDLRTRYELARIEAESTRVRWSVLSEPGTDGVAVNKRYVRTPLTSALIGLFLGVLIERRRSSMRRLPS